MGRGKPMRPDTPLPETRRFGDRLWWLMTVHGDTCRRLGEETGIPMRTIILYQSNKCEPTAGRIVKLADYYGVTTGFLLGRTDEV